MSSSTHTHVFFLFCGSQLPASMPVTWNKKMRKTAGYCITGQERAGGSRYARIELSEKVCDSAGIALLHSTQSAELQPYVCNATFVMLVLMCRSPQGHTHPWDVSRRHLDDQWCEGRPRDPLEAARSESYVDASRAADGDPLSQLRHQIQVPVSVHSLQEYVRFINDALKPFTFLLVLIFFSHSAVLWTTTLSRIGRHSKSLDTQRFVCALCTGQLVLLTPSKPRAPTPFANFVKENYRTARQELAGQSHAEVMRKLSSDFASKTKLSQTWTGWNSEIPQLTSIP